MPSNRLVNASQSPRCRHTKVNGSRCGAPARHGRRFCCFHDSAARRNQDFVLPIIEDHASLQLALNKIMQALLDKLLDQKTASTLLYGLQIAFANLKQLKSEQRLDELQRRLRAQHIEAEIEEEENEVAEEEEAERQTSYSASQPQHQPAESPAAADEAASPPSPESPVDEFLRQFFSRKSRHNQPRFDIKACIESELVAHAPVAHAPSHVQPFRSNSGECHPERSEGSRFFSTHTLTAFEDRQ